MAQITTGTGLKYTDIKVGDGQTFTGRGQTVLVHYEGWLETGEKFDLSRDLNEPFSFLSPAVMSSQAGMKVLSA